MRYGFRITLHSQEAAQLYYSKGGFSIYLANVTKVQDR